MDGLERQDKTSKKLGFAVLVVLCCVALGALIALIILEGVKDWSTSVNSTEAYSETDDPYGPDWTTLQLPSSSETNGWTLPFDDGNVTECNNIYRYVCHVRKKPDRTASEEKRMKDIESFMKNKLDYYSRQNTDELTIFLRAFITYYNLCEIQNITDPKDVSEAKSFLLGWPMLGENNSKDDWSIEKLWEVESGFKKLSLPGDGLIKTTMEFNGEVTVIRIGKPYLRLPPDNMELLDYWIYKKDVPLLFGVDNARIRDEYKKVFAFEIKLAELIKSSGNTRPEEFVTYDKLKNDPLFKWVSLSIVESLTEKLSTGTMKDIRFKVEDRTYFNKLKEMIDTKNLTDVANYLYWRTAEYIASFLHKDYRAEYHHRGRKTSLRDFCLKTMARDMSPVFLYMYSRYYLKPNYEKEAKKIIQNIRQEIVHHVKTTSKDEKTKNSIIKKVTSLPVYFGCPEESIDPKTTLQEYYKDVNLSTASFLEAHRLLTKLNHEKLLNKYKYSLWMNFDNAITPTTAFKQDKFTVINTGLLEPPAYETSMSPYEKYGSLGFIVADLFTKVFRDSICRKPPCSEALNVAFKALKRSELQTATTTAKSQLEVLNSQQNAREKLFMISAVATMCGNNDELDVNTMMNNSVEFNDAFNCVAEKTTTESITQSTTESTTKSTPDTTTSGSSIPVAELKEYEM